jgi:homoserine dehydrogenase
MKKLNLVLFGVGNVGSTLINQVLKLQEQLKEKGEIELNIPVILNSTTAFFEKKGVRSTWEADFKSFGVPYNFDAILNYIEIKQF